MAQIENFLTHIRTLQFRNERLRYTDKGTTVSDWLLKRYDITPDDLHRLEQTGAISRHENTVTVLQAGSINLSLARKTGAPETPLHRYMKQFLQYVDLQDDVEGTDYWNVFIKARKQYPNYFFTVDEFSGRVHTPVTSLHRDLRPYLLLMGEGTNSIDVCQMQPTLLAKILHDNIGKNPFTDAVYSGEDVYLMLQSSAGLNSREEAKKRFFEILFSKPNNDLAALFQSGNWINWINKLKSEFMPENPHGKEKPHSNLSFLLQKQEVSVMTKIWQTLAKQNTPFLSVHDELIVRDRDVDAASAAMVNHLSNEFNLDFYSHFKN